MKLAKISLPSPQTEVKNPDMSVNSNPTASQQNMKKLSTSNFFFSISTKYEKTFYLKFFFSIAGVVTKVTKLYF
jgi:hypothetical protein